MNFLKELQAKNEERKDRVIVMDVDQSLAMIAQSKGPCEVYTFGYAHYGRLGDGQQKIDRLQPYRIDQFRNSDIVDIRISTAHTLILLKSGEVISFGKCHFGQLGLGHEWMEAFHPQVISLKVSIRHIATGTHHSIAVSKTGEVYTWGCGFNGVLGLGDEVARCRPCLIESLVGHHITHVAAGEGHSLAVCVHPSHMLYAWGNGRQGQLGHGAFDGSLLPISVPVCYGLCIEQLVAAHNTSAIITSLPFPVGHNSEETQGMHEEQHSEKVLFAWGSNSHGQIGNNAFDIQYIHREEIDQLDEGMVKNTSPGFCHPILIPHPSRASSASTMTMTSHVWFTAIACGGQHCIASDTCGVVYGWGYGIPFGAGEEGACFGHPVKIPFPAQDESFGTCATSRMRNIHSNNHVVGVACGTRHSLFYTRNGVCFGLGRNQHGQLGVNDRNDRTKPSEVCFDGLCEEGKVKRVIQADGGTNSSIIVIIT